MDLGTKAVNIGDMTKPNVFAMIATFNGVIVNFPVYLVNSENVAAFKERWDESQPGLVWFPVDEVIDQRGPLPRYKGQLPTGRRM